MGFLDRLLGGRGDGGMGVPLLGSFATAFVGTLAAQALFADLADGELFDGPDEALADTGGDAADGGGGTSAAATSASDAPYRSTPRTGRAVTCAASRSRNVAVTRTRTRCPWRRTVVPARAICTRSVVVPRA